MFSVIGRTCENLSRENPVVRAVVQRVSSASVAVGDALHAKSGAGVVVLLGIAAGDEPEAASRLARKIAQLRIFEDERGRMDRSVLDVGGAALVVSQFTLVADTAKGTRPSFTHAAPADLAGRLYDHFCAALETEGVPVARGVFGARMEVALVNDGPVTIVLDA